MIEGRNIICIASDWSYDPTSKHHVMKRLAERNHIVWVNYHGSRRPQFSATDFAAAVGKLRRIIQGPSRAAPNITVVTPLVVPVPGREAVARLNRRLLTRRIRRVLRELPPRPVQLWSFAPDVDFLCGQFDEECVVYYCVDEFSEFAGYDRRAILAAERRLASRADLLVTTSRALFESKRALNANTILVPHGVDCAHFGESRSDDVLIPEEIAMLPRPILGFWGLLQDWVDVELLAELATARPDWSIVLIGEAATDVSALKGLANVHLLGRRSYAALPGFAKGFDLGLIPFRINRLTAAVNPIKLREYLSAGLPVVSTPLPEVQRYGELVRVAERGSAFLQACQEALREGRESDSAARQAAMLSETWAARVEEVTLHLRRCPAGKSPAAYLD